MQRSQLRIIRNRLFFQPPDAVRAELPQSVAVKEHTRPERFH